MSDEPALLAAIRAHPDEDTPRLIYADWLDESGRPERAEFIRLQCLPEPSEEQEGRAFDLEEQNRGRWLAWFGVPQFAEARWEFRRGFPEFLQTDAGLFLDRFDAFARVPWLRFLSLHGIGGRDVRDLLNRTWPPQWVEFRFVERRGAYARTDYEAIPAVLAQAGRAQVQHLRRLWLSASTFGDDALHAIAMLREQLGDRLVIE